jgi:hypothetical protein
MIHRGLCKSVKNWFQHNFEIKPDYERYRKWQQEIGGDGVAIQMGAFAPSPLQHIQRDLFEVEDLEININVEEFVNKVAQLKPDILDCQP